MHRRDNRTECIKARVTPGERIRAEHTATLLNLTISDLIRVLILEGAPQSSGLNADDRNSLNLILRYLQKGPPDNTVMAQLAALIRRIEDSLD